MALTDKREEAESLYVRKGISCGAIAEQLGIDKGTVYRWKSEASKKGEAQDWDCRRRVYALSPMEFKAIYAESVKDWIIKLKENPELLSNPKIADAIVKHVSVMQKLDTRGQYLAIALELIKVINIWLTEYLPDVKAKLDPHWDEIYASLKKYMTTKEIF